MFTNKLFKALDIRNQKELLSFSKTTGIPVPKLKMYNEESILPFNEDLKKIVKEIDITEIELKLKLGILDSSTIDLLAEYSSEINTIIKNSHLTRENSKKKNNKSPIFQTDFGLLYQDDCLSLMENIPKNSVDLIFADPPFNLNKKYESKINDQLSKAEYLKWTETWVLKCIELLKEGGSFFVWNLPVWNTHISSILNKYLNFRQWIAVDIKYQLPIPNKLYPAHYSLLYYTKGKKPNTFNNQRLPMEICRHCGGDIKDYGGYKNKLNKNGLNLTDVWHDLSPVRHGKYKSRESNELPIKLLERVISMASNEGDLIFDPFGGSGTTFIVSEILKRRWIGCEIGPVDSIIKRFDDVDLHKKQISEIQKKKNVLFTEEMRNIRSKNEHWLPETINGK
ncbi:MULTISPECIES: DNA-methyltransferase [Bacillus amyloliquefaciens group]|uniref:DNA-methyltransferase n=1 Tax=Bacillus amyloliquefaciens group TaxID=1938374 RepID=UPI002270BBE4|nr:site-specific DNA-methyltransferase [Bacillus velezensis]MCY0090509.1 site-specific DNA-methyltransferase [Bacillus velezensis]